LQVKALFRQSRGSGNALSFSEPGQTRLDLDTTMIGNVFTIDAWVKTPGAEGPQYVVQGNESESWSFGMQNNRLVMKKGAMPTLTSANLPTLYNNQWHHIATSVATDQCRFYFDGELVTSIDFTVGTTEASTYQLGHYLNGTMDEVRIWDRAINLTQIRQWMNRKITSGHPQYTNLVHYFTFDEPNFTSTMDMVGGTPAILVNNPQFGPSGAPIGDTAVISFNPVGTQGLELVLAGSDSMKILGWQVRPLVWPYMRFWMPRPTPKGHRAWVETIIILARRPTGMKFFPWPNCTSMETIQWSLHWCSPLWLCFTGKTMRNCNGAPEQK
jgi:hypothetical protein